MATAAASSLPRPEPPPEAFDRGLNPACDGGNDGRAVTLDQYLNTVYNPDCDYIDGHLQERNLGEFDRANLQGELIFYFRTHAAEWNIIALPELRLQASPTNFRVPDVMVLRAEQKVDRIVRAAPLLCIEILSPEDTFGRLAGKVRDYLNMGVENIWAFDPETREAFVCDRQGFHKALTPDLAIAGTSIRVALPEIFPQPQLDEL